ncbi:flagellar filament capping protein FliD [Paenibacillus sp. FSL R5-0623]|uniref:flagellar filament capping protein FliD n=1 Tax=Paenibacillus sp. FSL R5-0623 TaxID=2921651 RepID=UPI0030D8B1F3
MVTRINGFSGMDIDSMVKSMMAAKRVPLDKMNQQKQILEWTRDSYREINSKLVEFRTNKLVDKYGKSAALNTNKSVINGNTTAVRAEAGPSATGIDMKVSVTQLASNKTVETRGVGQSVSSSKTLADLKMISDGVTDPAVLTDADRETYNKAVYPLTIGGVTFEDDKGEPLFNGTTSIATLVSTINGNSKSNVTAKFDEITGKLMFTSKKGGTLGNTDEIISSGDNSTLKLFNQSYDSVNDPTEFVEKTGKDSISLVNGVEFKNNSNSFTVNGVTLTLLKETSTTVGSVTTDTPAEISIQSDTETAVQNIKNFVEDYNSLLNLLNSKVDEAKYRNFTPLTDEQKSAMKDDDIKNWTEKAKSGLLKNDDILRSTISSMRSIISKEVVNLKEIGINLGDYNTKGKLELDEAKLKQALAANPQKAIDLLQGPASDSESGIFDKLASKFTETLDSMVKRVGTSKFSTDLTTTFNDQSVMGKRLKQYNDRISVMLTNLNNAETRFYKQFTAMETAMSKLSSQSSSLFSSLGMNS